ncbi:hypothetical protein COU78_01490 [Candidatus Peregrinibacteria bacterium CG10_big_fil_rev_8_21_14_0_10_49_24]|nr:MAG: hypothetical protein COV83_04455 [Candidatus Peregrinibacteria bacterium CG11_big_fil_rev_8_21_14_0_20_49_14]PIR51397.1 MAG: hypothetical protein COU78_01490 [Candidatus Peregrinibacteria bacterium CG10_big_fil_rev_8_21_14_0_10_49_24]PJA68161.1 MAG: hypothetical protein CO157_01305 [Candidatus Peregrinibacteria bacterium CG_4_9_14_3_um_filter_49_12]
MQGEKPVLSDSAEGGRAEGNPAGGTIRLPRSADACGVAHGPPLRFGPFFNELRMTFSREDKNAG